jgi:ABC-type Fe3+-citrate transport system substrate-binding protein
MAQKNKGDAYQETLQKFVALAKDLNKYKETAN